MSELAVKPEYQFFRVAAHFKCMYEYQVFDHFSDMPRMMMLFLTSHLVLKLEMYAVSSVGSGVISTQIGYVLCLGKT